MSRAAPRVRWCLGLAWGAALLTPAPARAIDGVRWPSTTPIHRADPLAAVRWPNGGWSCALSRDVSSTARSAQLALAVLDRRIAENDRDARAHAARAVVLRLLERTDESRAALDRALSLDPSRLDDPDVALTRGLLLARGGRYAAAVRTALVALPRLTGPLSDRVEASVEIARWSILRGVEGLPDALAILRASAATQPRDPHLRATLATVLLLLGRESDAREVARAGDLPNLRASVRPPSRGTIAPALVDAAAALAASLTDHPADAATTLRASAQEPALQPFQAALSRAIARAALPQPATARPAVDLLGVFSDAHEDE